MSNSKQLKKAISDLQDVIIKALQDGLDEKIKVYIQSLNQTLNQQETHIWKPKKDEKYFFIGNRGDIIETTHQGFGIDDERIDISNYYKTKEEAEFEANCEKYTRLYRRYVETHDTKPIDWNAKAQYKWYAYYDHHTHKIDYNWKLYCSATDVYASNLEVLGKAIDFIGKDNFKKYVLRISE